MDLVPSLVVALSRSQGPIAYVKQCFGITPEQMTCLDTGVCDNCGLCPSRSES